jgi:FMN-dependent NADH-azoreductase
MPYLLRILADVWGGQVTLIEAEVTLASTVPATAGLIPLAEPSQTHAHDRAREIGTSYALLATPTAA